MPLVLWPIQPVSIYRDNKFVNEKDVLQAQRIHSLVQLLNQFSNITTNITYIFSDLYDDINKISATTEQISERLQRLRKVAQNTKNSGQIFRAMRMDWKLNVSVGAPTVHRSTIPEPMDKIYQSCVSMPAFETLEKFNKTDTPCSHKYSNPGFFMQQWITDLDKEVAIKKERRMLRREQKKQTIYVDAVPETPAKVSNRQIQFKEQSKQSIDLQKKENRSSKKYSVDIAKKKVIEKEPMIAVSMESIPISEEPAPIPEPPKVLEQPPSSPISFASSPTVTIAPPPTPAPKIEILQVKEPQVQVSNMSVPMPPPAPLVAKAPPVVPSQNANASSSKGGMDFLSSIRTGKTLKKVETSETKKVDSYQGNDVASILARRIQLAGCSDSDEDGDHDDDDDDWD